MGPNLTISSEEVVSAKATKDVWSTNEKAITVDTALVKKFFNNFNVIGNSFVLHYLVLCLVLEIKLAI